MTENPALQAFFASLNTEADLEALRVAQHEEGLYVEFKRKSNPDEGTPSKNDKEHFSVALSGFANADGGVLIWGMGTAKAGDGIDRADSLHPIADHTTFAARLGDVLPNATQPIVQGVQIVPIAGTNGRGYVKCLVPASLMPPHRSVLSTHLYYRRTSSRHVRMEHYELEDVFGRRLRPSLQLQVEFAARADGDPLEEIRLSVLNVGRGVARHMGLMIAFNDCAIVSISGHGLQDISSLNDSRPVVQHYDPITVIHANGVFASLGRVVLSRANKVIPLRFNVRWYAENAQTRDVDLEMHLGQKMRLT